MAHARLGAKLRAQGNLPKLNLVAWLKHFQRQGNSMTEIVARLEKKFGEAEVIKGKQLSQRSTGYWSSEPTRSLALLRPRSTADLSQVMLLCHAYNQPVVVQGGLTGCVEGAISEPGELIVSLERMTDIEHIDPVGGTVTVQAGVILEVLQNALSKQELLFPLDLGARGSCTIGGNIATNAGGINVLRYGMMRDLVLGLEVVLADGTVLSSMNRMLKNNAGYDLKQLFIGSEGTLGIVTRAVLRIYPGHISSNCALIALESFDAAAQLLQKARGAFAGTLSAFELMWGNYFHAVTEPGWHRAPTSRDHPLYVLLETEGAEPDSDAERFERVLASALEEELIVDAVIPKSESERLALWRIREDFEAILQKEPCYLYDIGLPIECMAGYVERLTASIRASWPNGECFLLGHVADGNLHLFVCPGDSLVTHQQCNSLVYSPLKALGGTISAEHGIGREKMPWLAASRTAEEIELMRRLKVLMDPKGILNRQRLVEAPI